MSPAQTDSSAPQSGDLIGFSLISDDGLEVELLNMGASICAIRLPTGQGQINAVLGYDDPAHYLSNPFYLGSTVGRYANRIAGALFELDGVVSDLVCSPEGSGHCLHGGPVGFSHRIWGNGEMANAVTTRFTLVSKDEDQGFPGSVDATVTYSLIDRWKLLMEYQAVSDAPTVISLANHAYFNLNSDDSPADNHHVMINADAYTPVAEDLIPTGQMVDVSGTVFDFRQAAAFGGRLDSKEEQLGICSGFDHNYILKRIPGRTCLAARLWSPQSGLAVNVHTTQPGLQFYSGQHLGEPFRPFEGICLEAQRFPNAPNTPGFPSATLRPGMAYRHLTMYEFEQT
jgi:aldose 1-epimerase